MLKIQQWLKENNFNYDLLEKTYGIKSNFNPDGRVILNYCQINSAKFKAEEIVRECRGLCLDSRNGDLIGRGFRRFFNINEIEEEFDWGDFSCYEKVDGSLVLIYYWNNSWHINTRNSYSQAIVNNSNITWRELIESALPKDWSEIFSKNYTYVGEICSQHNKVVVDYSTPTFFLLSLFNNFDGKEMSEVKYLEECETLKLHRPRIHRNITTLADIESYIEYLEYNNLLDEGFVLRDRNNNRLKCKSHVYLRWHHIFSNGTPKTEKLLEFILKGEVDELKIYFPEYTERLDTTQRNYDRLYKEVDNLWYCYHDENSRKRFAEKVKNHPLSSVLFALKDNKGTQKELFDKIIVKKCELLEK